MESKRQRGRIAGLATSGFKITFLVTGMDRRLSVHAQACGLCVQEPAPTQVCRHVHGCARGLGRARVGVCHCLLRGQLCEPPTSHPGEAGGGGASRGRAGGALHRGRAVRWRMRCADACRTLTVGHCRFLNVTLKLAWMAPGVTGEKVMGTLMEEKGPISPSVTCPGRHVSRAPSGPCFHDPPPTVFATGPVPGRGSGGRTCVPMTSSWPQGLWSHPGQALQTHTAPDPGRGEEERRPLRQAPPALAHAHACTNRDHYGLADPAPRNGPLLLWSRQTPDGTGRPGVGSELAARRRGAQTGLVRLPPTKGHPGKESADQQGVAGGRRAGVRRAH